MNRFAWLKDLAIRYPFSLREFYEVARLLRDYRKLSRETLEMLADWACCEMWSLTDAAAIYITSCRTKGE